MFSNDSSTVKRKTKTGENIKKTLDLTLEELYTGTKKTIKLEKTSLCTHCDSKGTNHPGKLIKCSSCFGTGKINQKFNSIGNLLFSQINTNCIKCSGTGKMIPKKFKCKKCNGEKTVLKNQKIEVKVEAGMKNKQLIIVKGESNDEICCEDVIFVINEIEHPIFKRKGDDLFMDKKINLIESLGGVEFVVCFLDGRDLIVKSKLGNVIKPNQVMEVENEGFVIENDFENRKGNLYVTFFVEFPSFEKDLVIIDELKKVLCKIENEENKENFCNKKNVQNYFGNYGNRKIENVVLKEVDEKKKFFFEKEKKEEKFEEEKNFEQESKNEEKENNCKTN
jgi:DnaJ homolog subfamily A member 2